RFPLTFGW
nr:Chain C, 8-Mer peptide from Protein Nef [Human immunodeficiency virus 1]4WU7_F Chain F, 8-Mer peptide from Protein Nef [Human immunodeficiency virus 1]5HGA_C Chain C, 8-mer from Protein Nef [Human immunodeficiency virus 1]5HGA_F Chain F, 8-mer from Protein Nef [Human immunodeficiency virus 1]8GVG_P Chain P, mutated 8-mer peptide from Protein Nef [HIV whole-genome vector AA1305\